MVLFEQTKREIAAALGRPVRVPGDFEALAADVFGKTGEMLSVNTLKRLFGVIEGDVSPRASTLDILARYLGAEDWNHYLMRLGEQGNSVFADGEDAVGAARLAVGCKVRFAYEPGRTVEMVHQGEGWFLVSASDRSKLRAGDRLHIGSLCLGYPLMADAVIRDGRALGRFIAGKVSGLTEIVVL